MNKILITGSAGFIGFNLHNYLSKYYEIIGCDNLSSASKKTQILRLREIKNKKLRFIKLDLNNSKSIKKKLKNNKFDLIIHLAAQPGVRASQINPQKTISNNLISFINIYEYAVKNKIKNIFFASSSSVYGDSKTFIENRSKLNPTSIYGVSKLSNEYLAKTYNKLYGINSLALRFFTVYGPWGREDMSYYKFFRSIELNGKVEIYGDKTSKRSFTYIDDICIMIHKLITLYKNKEKFLDTINLGNNQSKTLGELIKIIKSNTKIKFNEFRTERNKSDAHTTASNNKKINYLIKYEPQTSLNFGIKKFSIWYKKYVNRYM
jgi:UDP-glucuronate 4-epimerase